MTSLTFSGAGLPLLIPIFLLASVMLHAQKPAHSPSAVTSVHNPIFPGDYPDPSILKDGEDYYIVHSYFRYYPGLTIWHSKDLINWKPVANALHKIVGNVGAPGLAKYNHKYYIYFPERLLRINHLA